MANFWQRISALFDAAENSSPTEPAVHEMIKRDADELRQYDHWKKTLARRRLFDWLTDQYALFQTDRPTDRAISFLETPSSKGFVIHFSETHYSREEIGHFFHYLKERIQQLNYRTQISDRRIYSRENWVETQERHYLKPRTRQQRLDGPPGRGELDQKFGNVTVELELRDDRPWNLRLRATTYQDALYNTPESFRALMVAIAGTPD
ncbi:hypothetical protein GGR26_002413 [Lewinella marina]|uniref:Uncharacterized protein n=1 Tax=Neolewinella marina TaxID=438751 RepID=A0A2G0CBV4_9BACT|nr:hypothetical protein [Neolewinella marina]NJB86636.1 hypothetical protein [Neolewinella marina]PHK97445.1 hypothetical protein CGL56_15205 [Neolewinella marina]